MSSSNKCFFLFFFFISSDIYMKHCLSFRYSITTATYSGVAQALLLHIALMNGSVVWQSYYFESHSATTIFLKKVIL